MSIPITASIPHCSAGCREPEAHLRRREGEGRRYEEREREGGREGGREGEREKYTLANDGLAKRDCMPCSEIIIVGERY